jgi:hypothetical protein
MFTRPTTSELLEVVTSLIRDLRDHPENAPTAPLEVALEVTGVIERRIGNEPRWHVAGIEDIEALASTARAAHADPELIEAIGAYEEAWSFGAGEADPLARYEAAGTVLSAVSDVAYRHADGELIDQVFAVHTRRFERLSEAIGSYEAAGRT